MALRQASGLTRSDLKKFTHLSRSQEGTLSLIHSAIRVVYCVLRDSSPHHARPFTVLLLLSILWSPCAQFLQPSCWAAPYFRESGLVDIPTGKVVEHGIFNIGTYFSFRGEDSIRRDEAAARLDFGLFDRVEIGLTSVRLNQTSYLSGNLKVLLFRETGAIPNVAIGVENVGNTIEHGLDDLVRYKPRSTFLAISKVFNLPRIHLISGHIGIGNRRFVGNVGMGKWLNGVFFGISKDFQPAFARGDLNFSIEVDGRGVNTGLSHTANSGLQVYVGVESLNALASDEEETRFLAGVAWTNRSLMKQSEDTKRLTEQAVKIANQAKRKADKQSTD